MSIPFQGSLVLAPLTKGGNLPYRRLCRFFGADITVSEMAYARQLLKGEGREKALIRRHPDEAVFGVQIAAGRADEAARVCALLGSMPIDFIDLNVGCPIHDAIRRGMGSCLLQRPRSLGKIVEAMVAATAVPITVKIRAGWSESEINASEVVDILAAAGASAVTLHARTREQRYTKAADWSLIAKIVSQSPIPIIGNGDILTWYEARDRWDSSRCAAIMIGRGALIKPWIFQEIKTSSTWNPTAAERIAVYYQLSSYTKEHFRDDEKGRKRALYFMPFQLGFLCRYRYLPESLYREAARAHPLIQTRADEMQDERLKACPLERMLSDSDSQLHQRIAELLWESSAEGEALRKLSALSESRIENASGEDRVEEQPQG
ncbi:MAG: tRNA-dihydrouridine synthase family protein [Bdellovibrionota bacterium]|nr:MAG: tRNA-dihydrouridine synthase family protein [Bdellovibrionota bacterium]